MGIPFLSGLDSKKFAENVKKDIKRMQKHIAPLLKAPVETEKAMGKEIKGVKIPLALVFVLVGWVEITFRWGKYLIEAVFEEILNVLKEGMGMATGTKPSGLYAMITGPMFGVMALVVMSALLPVNFIAWIFDVLRRIKV